MTQTHYDIFVRAKSTHIGLALCAAMLMTIGCTTQGEASIDSDQGATMGNSLNGYKMALHHLEWAFRTAILPTHLGADGRPVPASLERSRAVLEERLGDQARREEIQIELSQALEDAASPLSRAYAGWVAAAVDGITRDQFLPQVYISENFGDHQSPTPWQAIVAGYDWIPTPFSQTCPECSYEDLNEPLFLMEDLPPETPGDPPFLVNFLHNTGTLLPVDPALCEEAASEPVVKHIECQTLPMHRKFEQVLPSFEKESRRGYRMSVNSERSRISLMGIRLTGLARSMRTKDTLSLRFSCKTGTPSIAAFGGTVRDDLATVSGTPMAVLNNDAFTFATDRLPDVMLSCGVGNPVIGDIELWVEPGPHTGILCWKYSVEFTMFAL